LPMVSDMKELKALREKATQGEWKIDYISEDRKIQHLQDMDDKFISNIEDVATAEYIAALHNANLIDRVEELEEDNTKLNILIKGARNGDLQGRKDYKALKAQLVDYIATVAVLEVLPKELKDKLQEAHAKIESWETIISAIYHSQRIDEKAQALTTKPKEKSDGV